MSTGASELWAGFFDDAAVFPPGLAPLPVAVERHLRLRRSAWGALVGPLLLPMASVREAARLVPAGEEPVDVGVIVPDGALALARRLADQVRPALSVVGYEMPMPSLTEPALAAAMRTVDPRALTVELSIAQIRSGAADLLAAGPVRAKFRTGGTHADAFPSRCDLAEVIQSLVIAGIPFKFTAGLHRPFPHYDPVTGFHHHGFASIAAATAAAMREEPRARIESMLASGDASAVRPDLGAGEWRGRFTSFGTCSIAEPVQALAALGLIDPTLVGDALVGEGQER